ncbi:MAG: hypothetical protein Q9216_000004 [Gyalolechia sp. 2 TL-2023]
MIRSISVVLHHLRVIRWPTWLGSNAIDSVKTFRHVIADYETFPVDLVQDLYLKEIRNYKAPPLKASDSEGHVQKFSMPRPPQSPEDGDIARDLKDYEEQQVELEGQAAAGEGGAPEENWFEDEPDDEGTPAAH